VQFLVRILRAGAYQGLVRNSGKASSDARCVVIQKALDQTGPR